jgi:hypothetical protein
MNKLSWIFCRTDCPRCGHKMHISSDDQIKVCHLCLTAMHQDGISIIDTSIELLDRHNPKKIKL